MDSYCDVACGLGFTLGALSERSETVERVWHTIAYLLFPLSGAVFMVDWMPQYAQKFVLLLPMVHGVDACGLGFTLGALSERSETVERVWHTIAYLLFPLSGAVFMVDWMPQYAQKFVLLLPMVHGVEMIRSGYFGPLVKAHYDIGYMVTFVWFFYSSVCASSAKPGTWSRNDYSKA